MSVFSEIRWLWNLGCKTMAIVCQRSESNLKPAVVCSLSINAFRFQRHDRFRRPNCSIQPAVLCGYSLCRMNMQRFRRAKRDEFLIHSADVMRSRSSSLRNLGLTNVMFTEPGPKTIICPWRMGNLLCTGTRSLRLAINNKPATAQLPKNSSAMRSLVCPERDERMEILSDHLYRWWAPWAHITEGKSLFFSQAPMCVCALTVLSLYDVPVHTPVSVDCSSSLTVIKERWQRIRLKRRHRGRSAPSSPLNLRWRMQEGIDFFFLSIHCRHTMFDWQRKYSMSHTHYSTFCVAKHFFHRFSHRNTFNSIYIYIIHY